MTDFDPVRDFVAGELRELIGESIALERVHQRLRAAAPEPAPEPVTPPEWLGVLRAAVKRSSQSAVARRIGASKQSISAALSGKRDGSRRLARRVTEVLMATSVDCRRFGAISPARCEAEQARPVSHHLEWHCRAWATCEECPRRRPRAETQTQATKTTKTTKKKGGRRP